jgi:pyruvate/2-oxoglutarate dehydrogenase complex dihydrolipoamide dehydrogenase (E3) component
MLMAAYPPGKGDFAKAIRYYTNMCEAYGVEIFTDIEVNEEVIKQFAPDAVVLATGGKPLMPKIKGIDAADVVTAGQVLLGKVATGQKVLVAGGGMIGTEAADYLADYNKDVTIIEQQATIASGITATVQALLLPRLAARGVKQFTNAKITEFVPGGAKINQDGEIVELIGFDNIVLAMGVEPNNSLEAAARDCAKEVHVIGDAADIAKILQATTAATELALKI